MISVFSMCNDESETVFVLMLQKDATNVKHEYSDYHTTFLQSV